MRNLRCPNVVSSVGVIDVATRQASYGVSPLPIPCLQARVGSGSSNDEVGSALTQEGSIRSTVPEDAVGSLTSKDCVFS